MTVYVVELNGVYFDENFSDIFSVRESFESAYSDVLPIISKKNYKCDGLDNRHIEYVFVLEYNTETGKQINRHKFDNKYYSPFKGR